MTQLDKLRQDLRCEGKLSNIKTIKLKQLEASSELSPLYQNIIIGRSKTVQRIIYFSTPRMQYYLDYAKLFQPEYEQLRNLKLMKRLISVIQDNRDTIGRILD